ncbi:hypothetical protein FKW31_02315 [Acetobacter sp. DmW_136]|uniref:hypothetical protein n=1 Tax=Acetobacter sp. DmW_136 TaxID=2591091 RepID=UPI001239C1DE|nr:hypothetical protein [Acetobacter sp. DmW_136]KAA8388012.1 hypothetical protein FKW31_02315 [Acetobacter sp. DmW_136]
MKKTILNQKIIKIEKYQYNRPLSTANNVDSSDDNEEKYIRVKINKPEIDRTGIRKNRMRKEITERLFNVIDEFNFIDSLKIQNIYTNKLDDIYKHCITDINYVVENTTYNNLVSLISNYPRVKPRLDFELDDDDQIPIEYIQSLLSLQALRQFTG